MPRPPLPPFTLELAPQKVRLAADAWNGRDPARAAIRAFLAWPWQHETDDPSGLTEPGR